MPLVPLKFKAGIVKDITEYASGQAGFYTDGNLVRFRNGFPEKIGGWLEEIYSFNADQATPTTVTGKPKHLVSWRSITDSFDRIIVGTHNHLYVINNSVFYDITPLRKTSENLTNPLVTTSSSSVVTVTDTGHGAQTGDFIVIKQATAVGGISADTINRLEGYQITKVDDNSYTFVAGSQASSGATGGGTAIDIQYLIGNSDGVGFQSSDPALGWGVGAWERQQIGHLNYGVMMY